MGSTFAVELPLFFRNEAPDIDSVVSIPQSSRPLPRIRATNIVRVLPLNTASEEVTSHSDALIDGVAQKLSILIVDDSSANRSGRDSSTLMVMASQATLI